MKILLLDNPRLIRSLSDAGNSTISYYIVNQRYNKNTISSLSPNCPHNFSACKKFHLFSSPRGQMKKGATKHCSRAAPGVNNRSLASDLREQRYELFTRSAGRGVGIKKTPAWCEPGGSPRGEEADAYSLVSLAWASTSPDFSPVTVFTKKYLKKTFGLPAEGVPHLASYFALMSMAVATGVEGSSKAAALL